MIRTSFSQINAFQNTDASAADDFEQFLNVLSLIEIFHSFVKMFSKSSAADFVICGKVLKLCVNYPTRGALPYNPSYSSCKHMHVIIQPHHTVNVNTCTSSYNPSYS